MARDTARTISSVARYYNTLNKYNFYRNEKGKQVCSLCFKSDCKHDLPKIQRKEGLLALSYWVDIAQMQAKDEMLWLHEDIVIPKLPIDGKYDSETRYDIFPRLSLEISIINVEDQVTIFTGNKSSYVDLPSLGTKATHYGYIFDDQFYTLKSFKNGSFFNSKGKFPRVSELPESANNLTEGFFYLLKGNNDYDKFANVSFIT